MKPGLLPCVIYAAISCGTAVAQLPTPCDALPGTCHAIALQQPSAGCVVPPTPTCCCEVCKKKRVVVVHHGMDDAPFSNNSAPSSEGGPGAFLAPPQSGTTVEGGTAIEVRGMSLTFPELKLALPSLGLPRRVLHHEQTRMVVDSAVAPYRQVSTAGGTGGFQNNSAPMPEDNFDNNSAEVDEATKRCEDLEKQLRQKNKELSDKLACVNQMVEAIENRCVAPPPVPFPNTMDPSHCPPTRAWTSEHPTGTSCPPGDFEVGSMIEEPWCPPVIAPSTAPYSERPSAPVYAPRPPVHMLPRPQPQSENELHPENELPAPYSSDMSLQGAIPLKQYGFSTSREDASIAAAAAPSELPVDSSGVRLAGALMSLPNKTATTQARKVPTRLPAVRVPQARLHSPVIQ